MTSRKDTTVSRRTPTLRTSQAEHSKPTQPSSGRVAFDERGNAVWEMRTADHHYVRDASTTLVRKLLPQLSIEATGIVRKAGAAPLPKAGTPAQKRAMPADAINPFGTGHMGTVKTFPVRRNTAGPRTAQKSGVKAESRPSLIGRLFSRKT